MSPSPSVPIADLPGFPHRRRWAWAASFAAHAAALGVALYVVQAVTEPSPRTAERVVYIEPAAAPPLGDAANPPAPIPVVPPPAVEPPKEISKSARLVVPHKVLRKPPPPAAAEPAAPPAERERSVGGVPGGVSGGEAGGAVGGVVGGRGDAPVSAEQVEHPPVAIKKVLPVYPPMARARSIEGRVVLRAVVARDGRVEPAIEVVESVPALDAAAIDALRQWRFEPGRDRDGQAVRVIAVLPIRFQLR